MIKVMYFQVLTTSILLHLGLFIALSLIPQPDPSPTSEESLVQLEYIDLSEKQIVAYSDAPNLDLINNKATTFQSKDRQRVTEETKVKEIDKTKNRSAIKNNQASENTDIKSKSNNEFTDFPHIADAIAVSPQRKKQDYEALYEIFNEQGVSTIEDRIYQDLKFGDFTALNTDQNEFYSFYERINDQIRIRWSENIENGIRYLKSKNIKRFRSEYLSKVSIFLNSEGEIINTEINKTSGNDIWDLAAINAFKGAAPFLNPPKEMLNHNGQIVLNYSFSLRIPKDTELH